MKSLLWCPIGLIFWVLSACSSGEFEQTPVAPNPTDLGVMGADLSVTPMPAYTRIELSVDPNQATYAIGSEIEVFGRIITTEGEQTTNSWSVVPADFAIRLSETRLQLTTPGSGTIKLCSNDICTSKPIFVVDQPTITLSQPRRGEMLRLDEEGRVIVTGQLENLEQGFPTILVNGEVADLDDTFTFSASIAAATGINELEIEVREPTLDAPPRLKSHFIAAATYGQFQGGTFKVESAIEVQIHERLLDSNLPSVDVVAGSSVVVSDIVQLLELIIQASDPLQWLPTSLTELEGLNLNIESIDLGTLSGDIEIPSPYAEGSFQIADARITTSGSVAFMDSSLSLDGSMEASLSAFMILDGAIEDTIVLNLREISAELLSIDANYPSSTLNDLIEALDSELTDQVIAVLTAFVQQLFEEQALPLVQYAFDGILQQIQVLPIFIPSPLAGIPDIELAAEVVPKSLTLSPELATLEVDVNVTSSSQMISHSGDLGAFSTPAPTPEFQISDPLMLVVKMDLLNALCYAIWKTGILNAEPELPTAVAGLISALSIDAKMPPVISYGVQNNDQLRLEISELQVAITPQGSDSADLYVLGLSVPATLEVDQGFITLRTDGTPEVEIEVLSKTSMSAINAQTIESLLLGAIWPMFQATLSEGLTYGIGAIPIDQEILRDIAPRLSSLSLRPVISTNFSRSPGVITVGGELYMEGQIRAIPPESIE